MSALNFNVGGDFAVVDGLESVTYYRRTGTSAFDSGTLCPHALRRVLGKETFAGADGAPLRRTRLRWHIWSADLQAGAAPKVGDVIQDAANVRYTVQHADTTTFASRFAFEAVQEVG
jgi:hypothetical protein